MEDKKTYDWADYYEAALKQQQKTNHILAGKLSEEEMRLSDLQFRLNRIKTNKIWRLGAPVRGFYHLVKGDLKKSGSGAAAKARQRKLSADAEAIKDAWEQECYLQKHPYLQWIKEHEGGESPKIREGEINLVKLSYEEFGSADSAFLNGIAATDYVVLYAKDGVLATDERIRAALANLPECMIAYSDEDYYYRDANCRMHPWMKPEWSPDTLLSFFYFGSMVILRGDSFLNFEFGAEEDYRQRVYRLVLEAVLCAEEKVTPLNLEIRKKICHIPQILFHREFAVEEQELESENQNLDELQLLEQAVERRLSAGSLYWGYEESYNRLKQDFLLKCGQKAVFVSGMIAEQYHTVYEIPEGTKVSAVILSKDHPEVLKTCLTSVVERTDFAGKLELIVVDNGSSDENKEKILELQSLIPFEYIYEKMEFNFSAMCNLGAQKATGNLLLLLNDDIEVLQKDWLTVMAGQALQPMTGAVGARLLYAGTFQIQHAGVTNLEIGPSHKLVTFDDGPDYYYGHNRVTYDMEAVTAACLMVAKSKFDEVDGLDETMKVAYNDVDFCFKLRELGYYNVLRNDAVLYHYESLTRGLDEQTDEKWNRLLTEKERLYRKHPYFKGVDTFYHPELVGNASDYRVKVNCHHDDHLFCEGIRKQNAGKLAGQKTDLFHLTVDHCLLQRKIHLEEPDIYWVCGWFYMAGTDNAFAEKHLLLKDESKEIVYAIDPAPWYRKDVEDILPGEKNISLAGFTIRVLKDDLEPGNYRIGMSVRLADTQKNYLAWSEQILAVREHERD